MNGRTKCWGFFLHRAAHLGGGGPRERIGDEREMKGGRTGPGGKGRVRPSQTGPEELYLVYSKPAEGRDEKRKVPKRGDATVA